jgi:hypothetical protein
MKKYDDPGDDDLAIEVYYFDGYDGIELPAGVLQGGACLWKYVEGRWALLKEAIEAGYERGLPPSTPGDFEGHIKKTPARRKSQRP